MFIGYRNSNVRIADGGMKLKVLAVIAWLLGVTFHYDGFPFGGSPWWSIRTKNDDAAVLVGDPVEAEVCNGIRTA